MTTNDCTCHEDWRSIPKNRRVILEEPGAITISGRKRTINRAKIHVYDRDCVKHGYQEITE